MFEDRIDDVLGPDSRVVRAQHSGIGDSQVGIAASRDSAGGLVGRTSAASDVGDEIPDMGAAARDSAAARAGVDQQPVMLGTGKTPAQPPRQLPTPAGVHQAGRAVARSVGVSPRESPLQRGCLGVDVDRPARVMSQGHRGQHAGAHVSGGADGGLLLGSERDDPAVGGHPMVGIETHRSQQVAESGGVAVSERLQPGIQRFPRDGCQPNRQAPDRAHPALPSRVVNLPDSKAVCSSWRPFSDAASFLTKSSRSRVRFSAPLRTAR